MQYLSKYEALIICFLLSGFFVGSLYFFNRKRQLELTRDHPEVIKKRFISILIVCIVSPFALIIYYYIRNVFDNNSFVFFLYSMGITYKNIITGTVIGLLLVLEIYFGPLVVMYCQKELIFQNENYKNIKLGLIEVRNVIVGPISEEFIFRSCMISICYLANFSNIFMIFVLPLFFGVAHVHHIYEYYSEHKEEEGVLIQAILGTSFQFLYTTIFGWFSTYLTLRTGNLLSSICAHSLCNIFNFPDVNSVFTATGKSKVIYMICYVVGLIVFIVTMFFVSKTSHLQSFFWN
ncbi:Abi-domain-containing protein [Neocallimastix lanati (nom. inval.)]|jgi:prenyl protein peptidase|uniref:intramembrane prenyl-peptidase Rce1 n=1 Tax=Neocallimastix californiae TaxID=1754190 RepID=A0A1Y2FBB1_9FUNG|nr:Abi-domain-containing protein [Neocallimastix sp. JGI-2020a]ORY80626.1 Abi-domain-containing protein [Neocallimastix californiae]|eukprot:ORY80626.1 Abi-domain-containing protein [Neocallimastix californiae]